MTQIDLAEVRAQVEILRFVKKRMAELKELERNAKDAIKAVMRPGTVGVLDGTPIVNWSSYKANKFDQAAFGEDHPDLLEQYRAMKEVNRFEIIDG